jgi:hypothetical protein
MINFFIPSLLACLPACCLLLAALLLPCTKSKGYSKE